MDLELTAEVKLDSRWIGKLYRCDITARKGLASRGLVIHVWPLYEHKYYKTITEWGRERQVHTDDWPDAVRPGEMWNITRAGRLVIDLLRECGLYGEYAGPLQPLVEQARNGRRVHGAAAS